MSLNLEKQLLFYGSYHHTPVNKAIHIVCVPMILMTAVLLGTNTPSLVPMPSWLIIPNLPPNLGTISALLYTTLYILMEPVAGGILAPLLLGGTAYSNNLTTTYGSTANYWALGLFVFSWIAQFIGHGVFEGRAPALLDNLVQAVFLAPFFVWMEILFSFGYRPELKSRVDSAVQKEVDKYHKSKQQRNGAVINGKANGSA
ncbi:hypothetical protein OEA41_010203 [Lepraria neglecta]|uniref:DUF962 domain-containing protein n=1 Tax=Lepraria neglecta TaxID=209136 RepID=A0AAD9Z0B7_9LECA|nr:hypothetical protein OEA41_010203 [Lepraria neglecta]